MPLEGVRRKGVEWEGLVKAWGEILDRYEVLSADDGRDVAYWHSEDALTALLATAAWQIDAGAGLVQFSTVRRRATPEESGKGFGDAWLRLGQRWYAVEAKLCWAAHEIKTSLELAIGDLWSLRPEDRAHGGLALCYCVPSISSAPRVDFIKETARDAVRQCPDAEFIVAYMPKGSVPRDEDEGYIYPGMVAVGQLVSWEARSGNDPWQRTRNLPLEKERV